MEERLFIVAYDISDPKRWRKVFKIMKGYGQWLQLSVFQCRCSKRRYEELVTRLDKEIQHADDSVIIMDLGEAESIKPKITSLGREFEPIEKKSVVI
jgi:CRISPR-associated protein Cas2